MGTAEARYSEELRAQFESLAAESALVYAGSAGTIQNGKKPFWQTAGQRWNAVAQ